MALDGIPEYLAESGSWAIVMPAAPLMAFKPSVPSVPVPESAGTWEKNFSSASRPPADAPSPTMGNGLIAVAACRMVDEPAAAFTGIFEPDCFRRMGL